MRRVFIRKKLPLISNGTIKHRHHTHIQWEKNKTTGADSDSLVFPVNRQKIDVKYDQHQCVKQKISAKQPKTTL